ncbi:hypothetical protein ACB092_07G176600 [Castanea dentata]
MAKLALVLLLFSLGMAMQLVQSIKEDPEKVDEWIQKNHPPCLDYSNIFDDPLTEGPEPTSKLVGRAQGLYGSAGQQEVDLLMAMNLVKLVLFEWQGICASKGTFSQSYVRGCYFGVSCCGYTFSISLLGKNSAMQLVREMPIVGGIGLFRLARGYAIAQMHGFDLTTGDAIVGYNVTVVHQG